MKQIVPPAGYVGQPDDGEAFTVYRQGFEAGAASRQEEVFELRRLLWHRHSSAHFAGLYGDDGEMQCGRCMLDFKRDPIERILHVFLQQGIVALKRGGLPE